MSTPAGRPSPPLAGLELTADRRYRALLEQAPVAVHVLDPAGLTVLVNPAFERMFGVTAEQMAGYNIFDDPQPAANGTRALLERTFAGEVTRTPPIRHDAAIVLETGQAPWIEVTAYPVIDAGGRVREVVLLAEDVTARVEAEQALVAERAELQEQHLEAELSTVQLQEQAAELEAQTEALQEANTDLEAARAQADAERARAERILETTADAYFALDRDFRLVAVNPAMEHGSGLSRDQLLGRVFWEAFPGAVGTDFERHYRRVVDEGTAAHFTHDYSDGRLDLVVDVDAYPTGSGVAVFWRDVTASARADAALRASEAKYRALFESVDQGFCIIEVLFDASGEQPVDYRFVEANPMFAAQTGLADAVGRSVRELVPGIEQHWIDLYGAVARTGEGTRFRQGSAAMGRWFDVYAFRVGPAETRRVAILFTDVSAAVAAEGERERLLAETEAALATADLDRRRLLATLEQLPVGVVMAEAPSGRIVQANPATRRIWGAAPHTELAADYSTDYVGYHLGTERPYASHEWPLARALAAGETVTDEVIVVQRPDGARRLVSLSAAPVRDGDGRIVGGVVTSLDVSEREQLLAASEDARRDAEAARERAERERERAEEANQAKGQFLANMSHELRTPLNAIGGYAQLLDMGLHGPVTEDQQSALRRIEAAQRHLLSLINDVLNYAKLESGRVEYDMRPVDVREVVREVAPLIEPQLRAKGLAFDVRLPGRPCEVLADREKLAQVLVNLLSNATKFTDARHPATGAPGLVRVDVATRDDGPDGGRPELAFVRVSDTGRGIPREKQEAVFEPFVQVRAAYGAPHEGTGLGLAISRDLARGMGGDLRVRSVPGEGSTFTVALRRADA